MIKVFVVFIFTIFGTLCSKAVFAYDFIDIDIRRNQDQGFFVSYGPPGGFIEKSSIVLYAPYKSKIGELNSASISIEIGDTELIEIPVTRALSKDGKYSIMSFFVDKSYLDKISIYLWYGIESGNISRIYRIRGLSI